ncbi:MAG: 3-deoxy-manno-octulosonate cytidylyltransferase [Phycisphaeraceae bacterium]|nr:MAG: 3-deoxy-manno-octulosonate cytidylyltransferase [Phycisphaeraceae bacterium]
MPRRRPQTVAIIPARLGSTRFPRKVLADDTGLPLIVHVMRAAARCRSLTRVVVATDAAEVAGAVGSHGGECVMTRADHPNGTSRLAEASRKLGLEPDDLVVNVQGDEPEMEPAFITAAVGALRRSGLAVSTVAVPFAAGDDPSNPNIVKVVTDRSGRALYFSRARIPFVRDAGEAGVSPPLRHVGLYVYRAGFLRVYTRLAPSPLERAESLEQLRVLWHGHGIRVAVCGGEAPAGIDTPEQYRAFVERFARAGGKNPVRVVRRRAAP